MKRITAPIWPLVLACLLSPALRLIPAASGWSPPPWELGSLFDIDRGWAVALSLALAVWTGFQGGETVKRMGAALLPLMLIVLAATGAIGLTIGLRERYLPLAGTVAAASDILLASALFALIFALIKKGRKIGKKDIDK